MSLTTIGIIGIVLMLALMFLRMPLAVAMALAGFAGFIYISGLGEGFAMLSFTAYRTASNYTMCVLPLFVLMGILAGHAGLSEDSFYAVNKWLGHLPGGLAMATVGGCAAFGAVCGSSGATAVTMCTVALPEMRRYKYADQLSLGTIACGGGLGFMIPPSIAFIIYAFLTEVSIGSLFMAGIIPGVLIALLFMAAIYITCRRNPLFGPAGPRVNWRARVVALYRVWGIIALFILVMGGMYGGIFAPSEAGAVGAFGALVLGLGKRRLTWKGFTASLSETARLTGMIFLIIIGAAIFSYFMTVTEIPFALAEFIGRLSVHPTIIMSLLLVMYIILGFFMEIMAVIMLTVPIIYPILVTTGIDPVWFGVLIVLTTMMAGITPPVGMVVYSVGALVKDVNLFTIFRGVWPFLYAMLIAMVILIAFPQISLWLPGMMIPG